MFGGEGRSNDARLERSESANEDILIFYFQMDLQTRIQVSTCLCIVKFYNLSRAEATTLAANIFHGPVISLIYCLVFVIIITLFFLYASSTSLLVVFPQYALNIEQFDVAKQLREKLTEVT